jgi:hypothetical protein
MTVTEAEDLAVTKLRAEGTPCNKENFLVWKVKYEAEMVKEKAKENAAAFDNLSKGKKKEEKKEKLVDKSGRISGALQFMDKGGSLNMEAMEAACLNAQRDEDEDSDVEVENEGLFDVDDDDLDDLDFDDDDEDDSDEEPDI